MEIEEKIEIVSKMVLNTLKRDITEKELSEFVSLIEKIEDRKKGINTLEFTEQVYDELIEIINELYHLNKKTNNKRFNIRNIFKLNYKNNTDCEIRQCVCYRTAELLYFVGEKAKNKEVIALLNECFANCTLTTFYYINLSDLETLILRHKSENKWCVLLQ